MKPDFISLCLIAKDEDEYLKEWLDYHILIGVERFYIYDNESKNPICELLKEYIKKGWVIVHEINGKAVQIMAYQHCLKNYGGNSKWIGFIDADEFVVLNNGKEDIKQLFGDYDEFGGVALSSKFFGIPDFDEHPIGGQIINYQKRFPLTFDDNQFVKCFIQPAKTDCAISPHEFIYKNENYCVNVNFHRVDTQKFPICFDKVYVNHYFMRSKKAFQEKIKRLGGAGRQLDQKKMNYWLGIPLEDDTEIIQNVLSYLSNNDNPIKLFSKNSDDFVNLLHRHIELEAKISIEFQSREVAAIDYIHENFKLNELISNAKNRHKWGEAKKLLLHSIKLLPNVSVRYTGYASTCLLLNEIEEAEKTLNLALNKFGKSHEILRVVGDYWIRLHQYGKAENCFREMISINEDVRTLVNLIYVLLLQNKHEQVLVQGDYLINNYLYSDYLGEEFPKKILKNCLKIFSHYGKLAEAGEFEKKLNLRFLDTGF